MVFRLGIRKKALRSWCKLQKETSGLKHVDMVNQNIPENTFQIDPAESKSRKTFDLSLLLSIQYKSCFEREWIPFQMV